MWDVRYPPTQVGTHAQSGQRERYFADDDRYDLKELVRREKMSTAEDQEAMMARLSSRVSSPEFIALSLRFAAYAPKNKDPSCRQSCLRVSGEREVMNYDLADKRESCCSSVSGCFPFLAKHNAFTRRCMTLYPGPRGFLNI